MQIPGEVLGDSGAGSGGVRCRHRVEVPEGSGADTVLRCSGADTW